VVWVRSANAICHHYTTNLATLVKALGTSQPSFEYMWAKAEDMSLPSLFNKVLIQCKRW